MALPTACVLAGRSAPEPIRTGFERAERTWGLTTDFDRSMDSLATGANDPTTRLVCAALTVLGTASTSDLPDRLDRLTRDRRRDADAHREAAARMAGARFSRRFVLIVPVGLALAGQSIGAGRAAYGTATGQVAVVVGIAVTGVCWHWSGVMLRPGSKAT
jgi:tight adherence protein B